MLRSYLLLPVVVAFLALPQAMAQPAPGGGPPRRAPDGFCIERYARQEGLLAYLGAKLDLTAAQRPLWEKWRDAEIAGFQARRDTCRAAASAGDQPVTIVERQKRRADAYAARAQALQTAQPALEALYQALTQEQRATLDHPVPMGPHEMMGPQRFGRERPESDRERPRN
jgi:hypothetical protein